MLAASLLTAARAHATDWAYKPFDAPPATYTGDFGLRFSYGSSTTAKNLYNNPGSFWHMQTTEGLTHFENHIVGVTAIPQPVDWKVDNFGMFLQLSLKFGPYPVID